MLLGEQGENLSLSITKSPVVVEGEAAALSRLGRQPTANHIELDVPGDIEVLFRSVFFLPVQRPLEDLVVVGVPERQLFLVVERKVDLEEGLQGQRFDQDPDRWVLVPQGVRDLDYIMMVDGQRLQDG